MTNKIIVYTDGACSGNQSAENFGGWGVVIKATNDSLTKFGGAVNTTNNKMEMTAVIEALKTLDELSFNDAVIEIYADSNYVIQGITSWIHGWKRNGWKTASKKPVENKELWIEMDALHNKFSNIQFVKVKGHAGIELNELADRLANRGVDLARSGEIESVNVEKTIEEKKSESKPKTVSYFDKLKLQIDNLELMYKEHQNGKDVSTQVYWQVEYLNEMLEMFEASVGADKIRSNYNEVI